MVAGMVTRRRLRSVLNALALYTIAALLIGYFGVNAYTGEHGLIAKHDLDQEIAQLNRELDAVKAERAVWERRVSLLKSDNIDPDLLTNARASCSTTSIRATSPSCSSADRPGARGIALRPPAAIKPVVSRPGFARDELCLKMLH